MRRPSYPQSPFGLTMTPMIDVVFQLLIFFVCTVEFLRPEQLLDARLPPTSRSVGPLPQTPQELDLGRIEVEVGRRELLVRFQGRTRRYADPDSPETLNELIQQLQRWIQLEPKIPVRIAGQPDVPTGAMLRVYDACLRAGIADIRLADNP
jgi:biopolymer transport protein ExbD